ASGAFEVTVANVAPTLTVVGNQATSEGAVLSIANVGTFTDPGFDRSPTRETFSYTIDWGDGTTADAGAAAIDTAGSVGVPTAGSFDGSHVYADNGVYTVTVTVTDDDGGTASETFEVTVANVAPTLTLDDVEVSETGIVTVHGDFFDPGFDNPSNTQEGLEGSRETFTVVVDWGDGTMDAIPLSGPGTVSFSASHRYLARPASANATSVFGILVSVIDDDGGSHSALTYAEMPEEFVQIDTTPQVPISTTPQVPPLYFPRRPRFDTSVFERPTAELLLSSADLETVRPDSVAASDNYVVLRVVRPGGAEGPDYRLPDNALAILPILLSRVPDNHYRIYEIHSDGLERLVRDVFVRQGRVVDHSDAAEGIDERPPQSHTTEPTSTGFADPDQVQVESPHRAWEEWEHAQSQPVGDAEDSTVDSSSGEQLPETTSAPIPAPASVTIPDAATPDTGSASYLSAPISAAGSAVLAFRLRAGWNQQIDRLLEQFSRPCNQQARLFARRPFKKGGKSHQSHR
ncbi:MAG: hypothetical protein GXY83_37690, partial [Rhodopirellula sp.]|nr:hypothetical protein [Rhodopirellula sp.]